MIQACYAPTRREERLTLRGHATGSPPVCAAASALVFALAEYAQGLPGAEVRLASGDASVTCRRSRETRGAFAVAQAGLALLERKYPELIHVSHGGRAEEITTRP